MHVSALIAVELDDAERHLAVSALNDWSGPAYGSQVRSQMCVASHLVDMKPLTEPDIPAGWRFVSSNKWGHAGGQRLAGRLALGCALVALGGFGLTPWLAYIWAVVALGLFTLVIWLGVSDAFAWTPLPLRAAVVLTAGSTSTALFWTQVTGWGGIPVLWSALAAISTRAAAWLATALVASAYGIWFLV